MKKEHAQSQYTLEQREKIYKKFRRIVSEEVKEYMNFNKMTREEFAMRSGLSPRTVSNIISGMFDPTSHSLLMVLLAICGEEDWTKLARICWQRAEKAEDDEPDSEISRAAREEAILSKCEHWRDNKS